MLNYEFPPMGGGAGNATNNTSKKLVELGHNVVVLTSSFGNQKKYELMEGVHVYRVKSIRKGIHDCGIRGAYSYLFFAYFKMFNLLKEYKFDIIHYFFGLPTGLISILPGKHKLIPSIVDLRGSDVPHYDPYNKTIHSINMMLKPLYRYIWRRNDIVITLSNGLRETARITSPNQEFEVVSNGIEAQLFKPTIPYSAKLSRQKIKLLTVSRLINRKGIDHVLRALAGLEDIEFEYHIIGTGNYEGFLKELVSILNLKDKIFFHGYIPRTELPDCYDKADVFVLPSLAESFGLVFAEAMACGLPIIGGRTGGVPEIVLEENGILVEPTNVNEIKDAIIKLVKNPELRLKMSENNRKRVIENYSWEYVAKRKVDIYKRII